MPVMKMTQKTGFDLMMEYLKFPDKIKSKTHDENVALVCKAIKPAKISKPRTIKFK